MYDIQDERTKAPDEEEEEEAAESRLQQLL